MLRLLTLLIAALCIAAPLLVLASWLLPFGEATAEAWAHVAHTLLAGYLWQTVALSAGVALVAGGFGVGCAWLLTHYRFAGSRVLQWALILPLAMPAYIAAYANGWFFEYAGPVQTALRDATGWSRGDYGFPAIRSLGGAVWLLGLATMPYVYILARVAFLSQPREWGEVAASLGAGAPRFFFRIALPAARPFIATGIALAMMETLADIGTVGVLGVPTLSAGIYRSWFFMDEPLVAARLSGLLLLFVFAAVAMEAWGRRGLRYGSLRSLARADMQQLRGLRNATASALCWLPVLAGFALPLAILIRLCLYHNAQFSPPVLGEYIWQTLKLGIIAGALACLAALIMVCAERFHAAWLRLVTLSATLGYAIPGAVVAVGLMLLFGMLHRWLPWPVMLTGSVAGLLIAYTVRFMATAYNPLHSAMLRIPPELDMAAASLGKGMWASIFKVHLPLLALPCCMAFLMVFIDTVKELPATLILRPFDVKTLGVTAYEFASDDRHVEASPYALALVLVSTAAVLLLNRMQRQAMNRHYGQH